MKYRKIDSHVHNNSLKETENDSRNFINHADKLGINWLAVSRYVSGNKAPEVYRQANDSVIKLMKQFPNRIIGQFIFNICYKKESLDEIDRCLDAGMVGIKVHSGVKLNDPLYYPIIERCIELKLMILNHAECELGSGGYRMKYDLGRPPNTTIPEDFVKVAQRYPEAMLLFAHICCGDWEYICKKLKAYPNVYVDVSGSNNDEGIIDFAVKYLGEDRILFGTDNSFYQGVGRILAANLNERQRRKIFFDNYNNILKKAGKNVD